jgi:hypothetical protein
MSINPTHLVQQSASAAGAVSPGASIAPAPPSKTASGPKPPTSTVAPNVPDQRPVSTDLRIDDRHRIYCQFVDHNTGSVVFEIPPEALRAIGESLNVPPDGSTSVHNVDVKS